MDAIIGANGKVEVQSALGNAITVTDVAGDSDGEFVVTAAGHGLSTGDVVVFSVSGGMVELDGQAGRVIVNSPNEFVLEGLGDIADISTYSDWTSGTCKKVSFATLASAQNVTMPNPTPAKLEKTTLIDKSKQYAYGLPDAPDGSIEGLFNPGGTAEKLIQAATRANASLVARLSFNGDTKHSVFNANWSGGQGFSLATNAVAQATISFTPIKEVIHYNS